MLTWDGGLQASACWYNCSASRLPVELPTPLATLKSTDRASGPNCSLFVFRIENMNRERLRQKRIHSAVKTSRRVDMD